MSEIDVWFENHILVHHYVNIYTEFHITASSKYIKKHQCQLRFTWLLNKIIILLVFKVQQFSSVTELKYTSHTNLDKHLLFSVLSV